MKVLSLGGAAAVLLVVVAFPVAWLIIGSFEGVSGPSLEHYRTAFTTADNFAFSATLS